MTKKLIAVMLTIMIVIACVPSRCFAASPYTKLITDTDSDEYFYIDNYLKLNLPEDEYEALTFILTKSSYRAIDRVYFPYRNEYDLFYYVNDSADPRGIVSYRIAAGTGCWAYCSYVESYVFEKDGENGHRYDELWLKKTIKWGSAANKLKEFITTYAKPGEHIRMVDYHSVTFLAYDDDGFYFSDYWSGTINLKYATWESFSKYFNVKNILIYKDNNMDYPEDSKYVDYFKDQNLLNYLIAEAKKDGVTINSDTKLNDVLPYLHTVEELDVSGLQIRDLRGINLYSNLRKLDCSNNKLTKLDLSALTRLERVDCSRNSIKSFKFASSDVYVVTGQQDLTLVVDAVSDDLSFTIDGLDPDRISNVRGAIFNNGTFVLNKKLMPIVIFSYYTEYCHVRYVLRIYQNSI